MSLSLGIQDVFTCDANAHRSNVLEQGSSKQRRNLIGIAHLPWSPHISPSSQCGQDLLNNIPLQAKRQSIIAPAGLGHILISSESHPANDHHKSKEAAQCNADEVWTEMSAWHMLWSDRLGLSTCQSDLSAGSGERGGGRGRSQKGRVV